MTTPPLTPATLARLRELANEAPAIERVTIIDLLDRLERANLIAEGWRQWAEKWEAEFFASKQHAERLEALGDAMATVCDVVNGWYCLAHMNDLPCPHAEWLAYTRERAQQPEESKP